MAQKETLEYLLTTQLDEGPDSWQNVEPLGLSVPDSWQKQRGSATAEEPTLKKRRSDAGMNSCGDVLKNLEDEIHQRAWDVSGNSEILEKQLVEIVQMEFGKKGEEAFACPARRSRSRRHPA